MVTTFKHNTDVKSDEVIFCIVEESCGKKFDTTIMHLGLHICHYTNENFKEAALMLLKDSKCIPNKKVIIVFDRVMLYAEVDEIQSVLGQVDDIIVI